MARSTARAAAMQLLYAQMMGGEGGEYTLTEMIAPAPAPDADDRIYIDAITEGVWSAQTDLDARIGAFSRDWPVSRMARVDLAILRLAAYEMTLRDDVPAAVSINEAVELSRTFSTDEAGAFINGILGNLHRSLEAGK